MRVHFKIASVVWGGFFAAMAGEPDSLVAPADSAPSPIHAPARLDPPAHSQWGYALADAKTGKILAENGSRRFFTPASVVKLFTTAFALDKLGPAQRFPTVLYRTGKIENGVLRGDLWIRGGGNPALGSERGDSTQRPEAVFGLFSEALEKAGIRAVQGNIRVDGTLIASEAPAQGALWEDVGNYYGAAPSGLCFHDNAFTLKLDGAAEAGHALTALGTNPQHAGISFFQVAARTSDPGNGDSCNILGAFRNTPRLVTGTCPAGRQPLEIKGSLPDPAWTCAREFEDYLRSHGVTLAPSSASPAPRGGQGGTEQGGPADPLPLFPPIPPDTLRLAEHLSPALIELVAAVHGYSDNFYAAQLLALSGDVKGSAGGLKALQTWLEKNLPGVSEELRLVDGNGLSRRDELTPAALVRLLCACSRKPWFPVWRETLLGGKNCPLKPASYADGLWGKLWTKTGSMGGAAALAGYIRAESGRLLAFTILVNHFDESPVSVRARWGPLLQAWREKH